MSIKQLIVFGATAYPEISELISDINQNGPKFEVIGILDDNEALHNKEVEGVAIKGPLHNAAKFSTDISFVLGIGSYKTRIQRYHILHRLKLPEQRFASLIHPAAKIYRSSKIGYGSIIHTGTVVFNNTNIDSFALIVANSIIGARNIIGKGAIITSHVATTTNVKIGSFSFIGTNSSIAEYVEIGPGAMIGMGSVVNKDIPPGAIAFGNPIRFIDKTNVPAEITEQWNYFKAQF